MNIPRSTFYKRPDAACETARERTDADLRVRIEDILAEFPAYGYRRVTHELRRRGLVVNHKRVARVMREHALTPRRVRAWLATTNSNHKQRVYPNLRPSITPEGPDELWVADLTYIRLTTGFVFLAVVLDVWSRRVIGYAISHLLDARLCLAALDAALELRQPRSGLVHHSDRGVQYASRSVPFTSRQARCPRIEVCPPLSRRGNPYDNAHVESFFKTLKHEEISKACEARYERRTEAVCTGSPRRRDPSSGRCRSGRPRCALDRTASRSPTRPAVGGLVESRADRQQATGRLPRR